jgi:hypothetical protein
MKVPVLPLLAAIVLVEAACTPARPPGVVPVVLHGTDGTHVTLDEALRLHRFTVIVFFSAHCPCQRTHDARLLELMAKDGPSDVGFLVVDSEESSTLAGDAAEARNRGYPIMLDEKGTLARALDAEYATYSVLVDHDGHMLYRGGFDSDKSHLRENRATYLADAIEDALANRPLRRAEAKTLGCTLQVR